MEPLFLAPCIRRYAACVVRVFLLAATLGLGGCSNLLFYPAAPHVITPDVLGLNYEAVVIDNDPPAPPLSAWLLQAQTDTPRGLVLFLHGNAENISTHLASVYWLPSYGYHVLLLDYRGYGGSQGRPSLPGVHQDAERALSYIDSRPELASLPLTIFGQSLGGAIAIYTAAHTPYRRRICAVAADSSFSSYRAIARDALSSFWLTALVRWPLGMLLDEAYKPEDAVALLPHVPFLVIHGEADTIVPPAHSLRLFALAGEPKELWLVPGAEHISALNYTEYRRRFIVFLAQAGKGCKG